MTGGRNRRLPFFVPCAARGSEFVVAGFDGARCKKAEKWRLNKLDGISLFSLVFCINL